MATDKKSFILYCDIKHTLEHLNMEQRGEVFTWIVDYVNDDGPEPLNGLLAAVVEPIKQQLKRDLRKYEEIKTKRSESGRKGGQAKQANARKAKQAQANQAVTVNDTVTVNVNDTVKKDIEERKTDFANKLALYKDKYSNDMLLNFFGYWSEHNERGKKMRFEMSKNQPFNIGRRLGTWKKNDKQYGGNKKDSTENKRAIAEVYAQKFGG